MKKIVLYILVVVSFFSCVNEVALPVVVDFSTEIVNNDKTVPVKVKINNDTEGADTYKWTFQGATPNESSSRNPGIITYEKEGEYTIKLEASNRDGSTDVKEEKIIVKPAVSIAFDVELVNDNYSPVEVKLINKSSGAISFDWFFEGGNPNTSNEEHPSNVVFTNPGEHKIRLKVSNGEEEYTLEKKIEVLPLLVASFDFSVPFEDDDYQVPVKVSLRNKSISATKYDWTFQGATITNSTEENPEIEFRTPGTFTIQLKASNSKDEKVVTKTITVVENTNIRTFENIKLGINTSHKNNQIGAYFSTITRQVYTDNQITDDIGSKIDLVFFGLNESFTFNQFVSPDKATSVSFDAIPNARVTKLVNKQETCSCATSLSVNEFDSITNDSILKNLVVTETSEGLKEFDNAVKPRIIVFETNDKRKGAIKIKEFVKDGANSHIVVDIKVQKEAN
ncbi:PKD domain-containing protein [uncultured Tenacibaculum sp.]|uniref:PKD domain-containing protein n=1 Tax=uncultured Tenacibaculum sp. TaxID=174713 RepID=UPI0026107AE3|nr:PKD domain-containing protein [uncultured Tenacibaculum sp.]